MSWQASGICACLFVIALAGAYIARDFYLGFRERRDAYIPKRDIDVSYKNGQFYVPPTMRDQK